jgi:hypothetical protein
MRNLVLSLLGITLLSGCAAELLAMAVLVPVAIVTVPVLYAVDQAGIIQPIDIVTTSGKHLTPQYGEAAKATFTVTKDAITCTGHDDLSKGHDGPVLLQCDKGLKGQMTKSMSMGRDVSLSIGPRSAPQDKDGNLSQTTFRCSGQYNAKTSQFAPFLIDCGSNGKAAIAPAVAASGASKFTVWIYPPY